MTMAERTIGPTKERLAHAGRDVEAFSPDENINWQTIRMLDGSPLEKLATAGQKNERRGITGPQYSAGKRYYADWYYSGLAASGVVDPTRDRVDGGTYKDISDKRMAAQTRFNRACKAIGDVHRHVLDDIVLMESPLSAYAIRFEGQYERKYDRQVATLTALRLALDALDVHYNGHPSDRGVRRSHAADYRPKIAVGEG